MIKKCFFGMAVAAAFVFCAGGRASAQGPGFGLYPGSVVVYRPGYVVVPNHSLYNPYLRGCNRGLVYPGYGAYYYGYPTHRVGYSSAVMGSYGMGGFPPFGAYGLGGSGGSFWFGR